MPLINLRTNLKSLVYGSDRPGGASSDQPFVTVDINTDRQVIPNLPRINTLAGFSTVIIPSLQSIFSEPSRTSLSAGALNESLFTDNFIRGGAEGARRASDADVLRIGSFITSAPKGFLFIQKQKDLQFSNPQLEILGANQDTSPIGTGAVGIYQTNRKIQPTRFYNPINTLKQVGENAFGVHIDRHGRDETALLKGDVPPQRYEYFEVARKNSGLGGDALVYNRLLNLKNKFGLGSASRISQPISQPQQQSEQRERRRAEDILTEAKAKASRRLRDLQNSLFGGSRPLGQIAGALNLNITKFISGIFGGDRGRRPGILGGGTAFTFQNRTQENTISFYQGGPNSKYGQGDTWIQRWSYTSLIDDKYGKFLEISNQKAGKGTIGNNLVEINSANAAASSSIIANALGTTGPAGTYVPISTYPGIETNIPSIARAIGQNTLGGPIKEYAAIADAIKLTSQITSGSSPDSIYGIFDSQINKENSVNNGSYSTINIGKITYRNSYNETVTINKKSWAAASREQRVGSGRQDSINLTPLFTSKIGQTFVKVDISGSVYNVNDLCKFKIEAIDSENPSKAVYMIFRAYLTDLSDDVTAEWSDVKYVGRGDKFYIYNGFDRSISVSFKVAALSAEEMKPMYQKLNHLMANMMPDYTGRDSGLMRGPLTRLTVGNWIDSQPGIIKSLNYKIPQDSPWEIAINEPTGGSKELVLPHIIEVSLTFVPIGAQTQNENRVPNRASSIQHTSYIAQNYNGKNKGEPNYIEGAILTATPSKQDENQAAQNTANADNKPKDASISQNSSTTTTRGETELQGKFKRDVNFQSSVLAFGGGINLNRPR